MKFDGLIFISQVRGAVVSAAKTYWRGVLFILGETHGLVLKRTTRKRGAPYRRSLCDR